MVVQQMVSGIDNVDFSKLKPGDSWSPLKIGTSGLSYGDACPAGGQCCLEALPCVSPSCSLQMSAGWTVVVALAVSKTVILLYPPPATFSSCFNRDEKGGVIKMTVSPTPRWHCWCAAHSTSGVGSHTQ